MRRHGGSLRDYKGRSRTSPRIGPYFSNSPFAPIRKSRSRSYGFEQLEDRCLLAVDIGLQIDDMATLFGSIEAQFERDAFEFTIPGAIDDPPRLLTVTQSATGTSTLDSLLTAFNAEGSLITSDDDGTGDLDSQISFLVIPQQTYSVEAGGFFISTGQYQLDFLLEVAPEVPSVGLDDFGDTFDQAPTIELDTTGAGSQFGAIQTSGDADLFRFVAPLTGQLLVAAKPFPSSSLDSIVEVFDAQQTLIAETQDAVDATAAVRTEIRLRPVAFDVAEGESYFVRVSGFEESVGAYVLSLTKADELPDDFGDTTDDAYALNYPSSGLAKVNGVIGIASDRDVFQFEVPFHPQSQRLMTVTLHRPVGGISGDASITILDEAGNAVGQAALSSDVDSAAVEFDVLSNQTFRVVVEELGGTTGAYSVEFDVPGTKEEDFPIKLFPLPFPDMPATISLSTTGFGAQSGMLGDNAGCTEFGCTWDLFEFTPTFAGMMKLKRDDPAGQAFRYTGQLFLRTGTLEDRGSFTDTDREFKFDVEADARYWLLIQPLTDLRGQYDFSLVTLPPTTLVDQIGGGFSDAKKIHLSADGSGQVSAAIDDVNDADMFKLVSPLTGTLVVAQSAAVGSSLDSVLTAFDGNLVFIRKNENQDGSADALVAFQVVAGETYFLRADSENDSFGRYHLTFQTFVDGLRIDEFDSNDPLVGQTLVEELLGGTLAAGGIDVDVDSIVYSGKARAAGIFHNGNGILNSKDTTTDFDQGILLTTGRATNAIGPNFSRGASTGNHAILDPAFVGLFEQLGPGATIFDPAVLSFGFTPAANAIELSFVFASEEYPEFVGLVDLVDLVNSRDVFGVFVNGTNFARLSATENYIAGTGNVVSIDSVNGVINSEFFVDNAFQQTAPFGPLNVEYDGLTRVIRVRAPVTAGETNNIAIMIADARDDGFDSAVFVQALSLVSESEEVEPQKGTALVSEFTNIISDVVASSTGATEEGIHLDIHQQFVRSVLKDVGIDLVGDFLVIPVDPVNFTLLAPDGSPIRRNDPNVFFGAVGTNELLIVPNAATGLYSVQLVGVGTGEFRFGASFVSASGAVTTRLFQGNLADSNTVVILDFRDRTNDVFSDTFRSDARSEPKGFTSTPSLNFSRESIASSLTTAAVSFAQFGTQTVFPGSDSGVQRKPTFVASKGAFDAFSLITGSANESGSVVNSTALAVLNQISSIVATLSVSPLPTPWAILIEMGWQLLDDPSDEPEAEDTSFTPAGDDGNDTQRPATLLTQFLPWQLILDAAKAQHSSQGETSQNADTDDDDVAEPRETTNTAENPEEAAAPVPNSSLNGDENAGVELSGSLPRESTAATAPLLHDRHRVGTEMTARVLASLAIAGRAVDYTWILRRKEKGHWANCVDRFMERLRS